MEEGVKDARGQAIYVGCKVSDGLCAGTVFAVNETQVWFEAEGSIGRTVRGRLFNRPENLVVIDESVWRRAMRDR